MRRLPGEHLPNTKNRSSKQNTWLTKIKPILRCMSGEELKQTNMNGAAREIERRSKRYEKTQARKQKYLEKLEAKRNGTK